MPTLQDLMATIQGGQGARPGQGNLLAALAPVMGGGGVAAPPPVIGSDVDSQIQAAINAKGVPDPVTMEPVPKQSKLWQRLIAGIADAGSVYASGLNGNIRPTNSLGYLLGQDQSAVDTTTRNKERLTKAELDAKNRKGEAQLQYLLSKSQQEEKRRAESEKTAAELAQHKVDLAAAAEKTAADRQWDMERDAKNKAFALDQQKASFAHSEALSGLERREREGDKIAGKQQEAFGKAVAYVVGMTDQVEAMLAGDRDNGIAPQSPEQIKNRVRRAFDVMTGIGLTGDARKAAEAYFVQEIGPILHKYEMDQQQAPSNTAPTAGQFINQGVASEAIEALRNSGFMQGLSRTLGPKQRN